MYTNRQILAAVLNKWMQPALSQLAGAKLMRLPFLANIEAKVKSTGWVSPMWSMANEVTPLLGGVVSQVVEPLIAEYLQSIPDQAIPKMAHTMVENAMKQGQLVLFEGNVVFELCDLEELQKLLKFNLPIVEEESYQVKTEAA